MDDLLDPQVAGDLAEIGKCAMDSIEKFQALIKSAGNGPLDIQGILRLLTPAMGAVRRIAGRCIDMPLAQIDHSNAPAVLKAIFEQNFSGPRLKPWVDLLQTAGAMMGSSRIPGGLPTPPNSSSTAATTAGGNTPATSSSSSSGPP
jgi:hypothetical protein